MKKAISAVLFSGSLLFLIIVNTYGLASNRNLNGVITSSGTTIVTLSNYTQEIYFIKKSTNQAYVNLCSTAVTTANGRELQSGAQVADTVEVRTKTFSFFTDKLPVEFRYEARWLKQ